MSGTHVALHEILQAFLDRAADGSSPMELCGMSQPFEERVMNDLALAGLSVVQAIDEPTLAANYSGMMSVAQIILDELDAETNPVTRWHLAYQQLSYLHSTYATQPTPPSDQGGDDPGCETVTSWWAGTHCATKRECMFKHVDIQGANFYYGWCRPHLPPNESCGCYDECVPLPALLLMIGLGALIWGGALLNVLRVILQRLISRGAAPGIG